ncbi:MAG: hypothetical protein L3J24_07900 [Xanthomonadales bacterium]|nr:hypothetical protein [Xanthomonadales bacterium]
MSISKTKRHFWILASISLLAAHSAMAADAASAKLSFTNISTHDLKITVGHSNGVSNRKTKKLASLKTATFKFSFGECKNTKERYYEIRQANGNEIGWGRITIEAKRENGSCKAKLSFEKHGDFSGSPVCSTISPKAGRTGTTNKGEVEFLNAGTCKQ